MTHRAHQDAASAARDPAAADRAASAAGTGGSPSPEVPAAPLQAISFDFGNTLVPVRHDALRAVVRETARQVCDRCGPFEEEAFLAVWAEERDRQFAEEVPEFREVNLDQRFVRVLARLRGFAAPPRDRRWDDAAAAGLSEAQEIAWAVDVYSRTFVDLVPAPSSVGPLLQRLSERYRLAVLSNWPLAATIDRFVEDAGWDRWLAGVVVSQRVGTIKPHPEIFRVAAALLDAPGPAILHVGDDWAADMVGAKDAGWRAAYLHTPEGASPLPASARDARVRPDLELDALGDLEAALVGAGW
jgi:FMN phosphatase YigB (HAD superfamily)